ncbi:MAG: NusG domain II-containing protein [Anaerofustis stercorihominis]|nr:NusG domain II-containing protein [Anaerofustis stercorihominis]
MKEGSFFKKKDIIAIIILLLVAGAFYIFGNSDTQTGIAEITVDGVLTETVNLLTTDNGIYELDGVNVSYEVRDGKIAFHESDCFDKVCVNAGFISMGGQTAVCLPNKVVISIPAGEDSSIDIMLR